MAGLGRVGSGGGGFWLGGVGLGRILDAGGGVRLEAVFVGGGARG